jgi:alanine transaminase
MPRSSRLKLGYEKFIFSYINYLSGAMYAFPCVSLPDKFVAEAKTKGVEPDFLYCSQLLEETGVN